MKGPKPRPLRERVFERLVIDPETGCLLWTGSVNGAGYGQVYVRPVAPGSRRKVQEFVHRLMYEWFVGPIPDGTVIDHLCRTPRCAAPAHLEAVTQRQNVLRGVGFAAQKAAQTHCVNGHEFTEANTKIRNRPYGGRQCRECNRIRDRERRPQRQPLDNQRRRERRAAARQAIPT